MVVVVVVMVQLNQQTYFEFIKRNTIVNTMFLDFLQFSYRVAGISVIAFDVRVVDTADDIT